MLRKSWTKRSRLYKEFLVIEPVSEVCGRNAAGAVVSSNRESQESVFFGVRSYQREKVPQYHLPWQNVSKKETEILFNRVNMVRAGVVKHPSEWAFSGYNEIQKPRQRYALIDDAGLMNLV